MALANILNSMKNEGYILKDLDMYLMSISDKDSDRRWDINSPSMASQCCRAIYYSRTNTASGSGVNDPRSMRILDNGTHVHLRLQEYLKAQGMLLMDEVPVVDEKLQIMGHSDGILALGETKYLINPSSVIIKNMPKEIGVLEIKSINTNNFSALITAKDEHKVQAQVYMNSLEKQRLFLKDHYDSEKKFEAYMKSRKTLIHYRSLYGHLKNGAKFTREQKIMHSVDQHMWLDKLLWNTSRPVGKIIFLYENKNDQTIKEFCIKKDAKLLKELEEKFEYINDCVVTKKLPDREGTSKSCTVCRWCRFKDTCFVL